MHLRTYMYIEKPVCVQFPGTVEEEMLQKWTKGLCAFPSWLLSEYGAYVGSFLESSVHWHLEGS